METVLPSQSNSLTLPLVAKATGNPLESGTVNFYLYRKDTQEFFRTSDDSWQAAESVAAVATHVSDGHWYGSIDAAAWIDETSYLLYAKESGDLHIPVSLDVLCNAAVDSAVVAALKSEDGWLTGSGSGTLTFKQIMAVLASWSLGRCIDKPGGPTGTYQILDPEDDATVIFEITLQSTTPFKQGSIS